MSDSQRDRDDEDEGQRPRFALPGVKRFGEEDATNDEAAAFGAVGAGKKMRRMIEHHRRLFPAADRAMLRRKWDEPRSEALLDHIDTLADTLGIDNLEGVGVRGTTSRTRIITLVTRGQNGRAHKSWLPYSVIDSDGLEDAKAACERSAVVADARRRGMVVGLEPDASAGSGDSGETEKLRKELAKLTKRLNDRDEADAKAAEDASAGSGDSGETEKLRKELAKLTKRLNDRDEADAKAAEDASAGSGDSESPDDLPLTITAIKDAIKACENDEEREQLKARVREAELERDEAEQRQGVLDATEPAGD